MKEVIINRTQEETIDLANVTSYAPIFAKRNKKFAGMLVKEDNGWILRIGRATAATGHYNTVDECVKSCIPYGYTFFVN